MIAFTTGLRPALKRQLIALLFGLGAAVSLTGCIWGRDRHYDDHDRDRNHMRDNNMHDYDHNSDYNDRH